MPTDFDTIVVGAGLAGASVALGLSQAGQRVCVVDSNGVASGASGSGAGLVSPMMSRKGRPVWRAREALDRLNLPETGLLRPASSNEQAAYFIESSEQNPDLGFWMGPEEAASLFPYCQAPYGLVRVTRGCAIDLSTLTHGWLDQSTSFGAVVLDGIGLADWQLSNGQVIARLSNESKLVANRMVLATGPDLLTRPETKNLNLHPIKGERIRVKKPSFWSYEILPLSGSGFIIDEGESLSIGATFEHEWTDPGPTQAGAKELIELASQMMPEVRTMDVIEHTSGIRITVPGTRMPMIGPLPDHPAVWVFTGLGSKGILMSALLGMKIPQFFNDITSIPASCRVAIRKSNT